MVASRIVSSVAGLIGLALIAKDIYEAGEGVFPIVADRMKSDETKTLIKDEIGKTIQADITQQAGTYRPGNRGADLFGLARLQAKIQAPAVALAKKARPLQKF